MNIVWFSWKDLDNPLAGGAEVVTDQLLSRAVADGHQAVLVCGGFTGGQAETSRNGYRIVRVGNRLSVYIAAWRYYRQQLRDWAELVIDECNTVPFFAGWYVKSGTRGIMFFHMLCRQIWFYELPKPLGMVGYLAEPVYLRLLRRWPVVTVSDSTRQDLQRSGFRAKDITVISEGITAQPVADLAKIKKFIKPTVLSLGTMRSMKCTLDQVRAFELAKQRLPDLQLKVAGDSSGAYGKRVLAAIEASPYRADIAVLGRVSDERRAELMQRSHALLVSSVKEGWGLVVTEANSQGTPAVVYDVDGLRDSVRDGETGIITPTTPSGLADGVVRLLQDQPLYDTIRANAHVWSKTITFEQSYEDFKKAANL